MKSIFRPFILLLLLVAGSSLADGATVTPSKKYVTRKVTSGAFDAVRTNTSLDIIYTVGPRDINIYAPDNLMPYIQVTLKGSEIIVNYKENMTIKSSHNSYVKISAPDVVRFTAGSAGDIKIKSDIRLKNDKIELSALSAGDIEAMNIEADEVNIRANSAGDIETRNIAATKDAKIITNSAGDISVTEVFAGAHINIFTNSAGDIEIGEVSAPDVSVGSNSSGNIEIKTIKSTNVAATVNSAGDIRLSGICSTASFVSGSSGCIYARGLKATNASATARGVGDIECHAFKSLSANRFGSGEIRYAGNPSNVIIQDKRKGGVSKF